MSASLQRFIFRSVRLVLQAAPHAQALRDFSQQPFFRQRVEPQEDLSS
jgi:hypothetical protein